MTADPERAFITVDSGFPITALEEALQKNTPFAYPFASTSVPVLFSQKSWAALSPARRKYGNDLIDILLHNKDVDRLYSALSRNDGRPALPSSDHPDSPSCFPMPPSLIFTEAGSPFAQVQSRSLADWR